MPIFINSASSIINFIVNAIFSPFWESIIIELVYFIAMTFSSYHFGGVFIIELVYLYKSLNSHQNNGSHKTINY